jgi:hypothetical protein
MPMQILGKVFSGYLLTAPSPMSDLDFDVSKLIGQCTGGHQLGIDGH